jgi:hypothetical protein
MMLTLLVTDTFADWFAALDDETAEDAATALEVIEQVGPARSAPGSRESLLWYEHPSVSRFEVLDALDWELEAWGCFRDYAKQILAALGAPRFTARLAHIGAKQAEVVMRAVRDIKRATDPRTRWALKLHDPNGTYAKGESDKACGEIRRLYFTALEAAGFEVEDVAPHSRALRELSQRKPERSFRLLYGVDAARGSALAILGERLDRSFYGDSVRRAEHVWKQFLEGTGEESRPWAHERGNP